MNKKGSKIILATTVMVILMALGLFIFVAKGAEILKPTSAVNRLDSFEPYMNKVIEASYDTTVGDFKQAYQFPLSTKDLYLFFSSGGQPIYLSHKYQGEGSEEIDNDLHEVTQEHYLKFERPGVKECSSSACMCYCKLQNPPWVQVEDEPYLAATQFKLIENKKEEGYNCIDPVCMQVGDATEKTILFGNSRGAGDAGYILQTQEAVEASHGSNKLHPISMDVSLLIQNEVADEGNFLFSVSQKEAITGITYAGTDYNYVLQDDDIVEHLIKDYYWENGFALGGTATSGNEKTRKQKEFANQQFVTLTFETRKDYPGVIGVCLEKNCLFSLGTDKLLSQQESIVKSRAFIIEAKNRFLELEEYLKESLAEDLLTTSVTDTLSHNIIKSSFARQFTETFAALNAYNINAAIVLKKTSNPLEMTPSLMINGVESLRGETLLIPFPSKNSTNQFEEDIYITNFKDNTLIISSTNPLEPEKQYTLGLTKYKERLGLLFKEK